MERKPLLWWKSLLRLSHYLILHFLGYFLFTLGFCEKNKREKRRRKSEKDPPVQAIGNNSREKNKKFLPFSLSLFLSYSLAVTFLRVSPCNIPLEASSSFDRLQLWDPEYKRNSNITDKFEKFHNWFLARENKVRAWNTKGGWERGRVEGERQSRRRKQRFRSQRLSDRNKRKDWRSCFWDISSWHFCFPRENRSSSFQFCRFYAPFPPHPTPFTYPPSTSTPFSIKRGHKLKVDSTNWTRKLTSFRYQQFLLYITLSDTCRSFFIRVFYF